MSEREWQDIETAPREGGPLLLLACADWAHSIVRGKVVPIKVGGYWNGSWHIFGGTWQPTHWQPLPPPPSPIKEE